jgi:putative membrane-bound dehydrogenase-like protein
MQLNAFMRAIFLSACLAGSSSAASLGGIKPQGADGKPLNLSFESGTLNDWTATGTAFAGQPIKGDLVSRRRTDMKSEHEGEFWIGGFETKGDPGTGTLTSVSFKVSQPWASFLVGGGPDESTRVELVTREEGKETVIYKVSGVERENLQRAVVDLQKFQGKEIFVRLVDQHTGHWGHLNFDDFVFHAAKPSFANAIDTSKKASLVALPPTDDVKFSGLSAAQAVKEVTLPAGFKVTLFAGEPDIQQPIAFCLDERGRLWVAEGYTYPRRKGAPPSPIAADGKPNKEQLADIFGSNDRILVFEDSNNDGTFDKRTVFLDKLNLISGLEVGFGGVWIGAAPYLMFVPVTDWDEPKPAGDPQVLLDGWDFLRDTHETLNTFQWGPDGWLYGCHGVFCPSNVGKPGTPKSQRQWVDAAVWRYHPTKRLFEVFSEGTSNPWGLDFDEHGQAFIEACVIPHLFHMIQGARYHRQGGAHYAANADEIQRFAAKKEGRSDKTLHPFIYDDIKTIADHRHYVGDKGPHAANNRSDAAGGGHAHAGLLVYQGDSFPAEYRGKLFMNNIHGQRINMDSVERKGSGFVGKHGADFLNFNDKWSQAIDLRTGPDGSVFVIDWYDKNQCHHNNVDGHDRGNGRIFKVSYGSPKQGLVDLRKESDAKLIELALTSKNSWHARTASRLLQERGQKGTLDSELLAMPAARLANAEAPSVHALRHAWLLHVAGKLHEQQSTKLLQHPTDIIRAWAIQLACEDKNPSDTLLKEFARMAREDKSPVVRLYLASALQRLPNAKRTEILEALLAHSEDATDHNLPLMYWYAAEPVAGQSVASAARLLAKTKIPLVREYITRRMTAK